jgi:hypothetical protein
MVYFNGYLCTDPGIVHLPVPKSINPAPAGFFFDTVERRIPSPAIPLYGRIMDQNATD